MAALVESAPLKASRLPCLVGSALDLLGVEGVGAGATEEELLAVALCL